jgi:hypothetical protein
MSETVQCKICSKWLKKKTVRNHVNIKHFESYPIGSPLKDLYDECDKVTEFKIKKIDSLQTKNRQTMRGPFVKARFCLAGEFEHESQVLRAEIRDLKDEPVFKQFLETAATRTSGRATVESRSMAKRFKKYANGLRRLEGRRADTCAICTENFEENSDALTFMVKNSCKPCHSQLHQIHRECRAKAAKTEGFNLLRCMICRKKGCFLLEFNSKLL